MRFVRREVFRMWLTNPTLTSTDIHEVAGSTQLADSLLHELKAKRYGVVPSSGAAGDPMFWEKVKENMNRRQP